jgi:hypothetical protein
VPTGTEIQEQLTKFAETSKRTIGAFVSKVKAKIQEFDQGRQDPPGGMEPQWGSATTDAQSQPYQSPAQQQSFYDPNPSPDVERAPIQLHGYDLSSPAEPPSSANLLSQTIPPVETPSDTPAAPNSASTVDYGKIGLLPKRPVSLLKTETPPPNRTTEEEDGLEYVENPFEDRRK